MADRNAFDAWYGEVEGFAIRAERLTGPKDELQAAFEAGAIAERERAAVIAEEHQVATSGKPNDYTNGYNAAAEIIAAAIRNPPEQPA